MEFYSSFIHTPSSHELAKFLLKDLTHRNKMQQTQWNKGNVKHLFSGELQTTTKTPLAIAFRVASLNPFTISLPELKYEHRCSYSTYLQKPLVENRNLIVYKQDVKATDF